MASPDCHSPAAQSGHYAGAHGGGGCAPAQHVLQAGASPPFVWWPTQTHRQSGGGSLGPHVIERGREEIQINGRRRSLVGEALHREAVEKHFAGTKHLFESEKTSVGTDQSELKQSIFISLPGRCHTEPGQRDQAPRQGRRFLSENKPVSRRSVSQR